MEKRHRALLLLGLLLVAFNFRPAITSVPPIVETLRAELHLSYTVISLLTTIPTVLIGIFAFIATPISRTVGRERAIFWAIILVTVSTGLRLWGANVVVLFGTTVLVGAGIAVSQALLPAVILDYFADRAALVTGLYTASLGLGAAAASGGTAVLANLLGSWTSALAFWAIPGGLAVAVFVPIVRSEVFRSSPNAESPPGPGLWVDAGAWILAIYFSLDNVLYFAQITWIAPLYVDLGWTAEQAGFLLTLFLIAQLTGSISISALADRWQDRRPWLALTIVLNTIGLVGFIRYPFVSPWGWALLAGVGLGGLFALIFTLPVDLAANATVADQLTPMMLGVGYIVGATGPFVIGWIRDTLGSYDPAFVGLIVLDLIALGLTIWFRPDRTVSLETTADGP